MRQRVKASSRNGFYLRLLTTVSVPAFALLAVPTAAQAQDADRNWDANGTAVGNGGTGTWNTTSATWSPNTDGVSGPYGAWNNATLDNPIFGGTAGTVTLGVPITVHNITFNTTNYTLTGNTLTLAGTTPTITTNPGITATINSIVAGTAGLTKAGNGILTLGGNNTFTGGVTVSAGTLNLNGTNGFTGNLNLNAGALNLNGSNTFTGAINVNAGTLFAASNASLGNSANVVNVTGGATLRATGLLTGRVVNLTSGQTISYSGSAAAHFTGIGGLYVGSCSSCGVVVELSDTTNDFTGQVKLAANNATGVSFRSVRDSGQTSAVGAGTAAIILEGNTTTAAFNYTGIGDSSNRDWQMTTSGGSPTVTLLNKGTGTLTLTGNISVNPGMSAAFQASSADLEVLGVISGANNQVRFLANGVNTLTLGTANTFTAGSSVESGMVKVGKLADGGASSSLGAGTSIAVSSGGTLSYTGGAVSSDRTLSINNGTLSNDGSGGLTLSGAASLAGNLTLAGSYTGADNTLSGIISGSGGLINSGPATWVLSGANTRTGAITVNGGTLRGTNASAFGTVSGITVNGGTLDTGGFNLATPTIAGTGGTIALGAGTLSVNAATAQTFGGSISGSGGLTKLGIAMLTLSGTNSYTGATTINNGTVKLDFTAGGAPASNILSNTSTVSMAGGTLNLLGKASTANSQTFGGLTITGGNNTISATSGTGGSMTVNFGAISRTNGLVNFVLPTSGSFTTSNLSLGSWATVNGSDYADVVGGNIVAFTGYVNKDDAATWVNGDIVSDESLPANSAYNGTLASDVALGGIKYTASAGSNIGLGGHTLSTEGAIIVAPGVGNFNLNINGGNLTGGAGGSTLGVQQNSAAAGLNILATIIDNGGATGFAKSGVGTVALSGPNTYTGATTISQGTLWATSIANGGVASAIGASTNASSNLVIQGATLQYAGATATSDRGFTIETNGAIAGSTIDVTQVGSNLTFSGLVTSPDGAGLTKTGAGTLTLAGAGNDYAGVTTVSGGTLAVSTLADGGSASSIGASSSASSNLVLQNGGELEYTGGTIGIDRGFTLGAGGGAIDVATAATTLTMAGTVAGTGTLSKNGAGTLVLSASNVGFTAGGFVNAGTLRAGSTTRAFGSGGWTVASGATLDLNGFSNTINVITGGGAVTLGAATLTINNASAAFPFSGVISGSGGLTLTGGTQVMSGCGNTYTGATTITGGTLNVDCLANGGSPSGIGASGTASTNLVFNNGVLNYTGATVTTNRGFQILSGTGAIGVQDAGTTLTFTGVATGAGTLRKDGAGTLVLSGANTLTGATSITGGVLRVGSATALAPSSMSLSNVAGAALDLNNFNSTFIFLLGGGTLGGNIALGSGNLTLNYGATTTQNYAGAISGTGGFIKGGAASFVQVLSGCNSSYSGATTINSGTLEVGCLANGSTNSSIGSSSSAATNLIISGGTLRYVGTGGSTDRLFTLGASANSKIEASGTGALSFTNTGAIAFSSPNTAQTIRLGGTNTGNNSFGLQITNNSAGLTSFTKEDAGTWILTNQNSTYTGVTTISGGVLGVDKLSDAGFASSIGASSIGASNLVIGEGSTLRYTGSGDSTNRLFTLDKGVSFIESSGTGAIAFTNTGAVAYADPGQARVVALGGTNTGNNIMGASIGNSGAGVTTLAKNDAGTWILTGTNTYTGPTNVNGGVLYIGNGGTTGSIQSTTANIAGGSTLGFNRSDAVSFAGTIAGAGAVQQLGTGTTTLTGANTYTGGTTISAGTLQLGSGGATGSIVGNVTNNGTLTFNRSDSPLFAGTISGTGAVKQIGTGTTVLTANNSYTGGTTISAGTLQIGSGGTTGSIVGDVLSTGGTLSFRRSDTVTYGGVYSGTGGLTASGGTLILTGNNSYSGDTVVATNGRIQVGNGGTTGSIASNVKLGPLASTLVFNRSDTLTYAGIISGASSTSKVIQAGTGTTVLAGTNTYVGTTDVNAGTLLINGNQSGATGLTSVASGATLGGTGTIGGSVTITDGGTLAAGSNGVGALTINGNLALGNTTQLNFEFGQANVPGGLLNDLVNVGGNLTLDGTVNVTQSPGGSFGPGVYRMFNYSGALTDNGATLGTLPGGSAGFIQTVLANQVNLVNTAGLTLNFWDGAAGPKNDSLIQGGNGTWRVGGGDNNWTDGNGLVNADYAQDSFAIFQGTGGTVTIDNVSGNVSTAGMQFTANGYTITGGALSLTGTPDALIRVGDGSPGDASLTATIDAPLTGSARLVKTDSGTLVLTGTNAYTGGTAINGGTLRISSDTNLGDAAGSLSFNGGTLNTTASITSARAVDLAGVGTFLTDAGTTLALSGAVSGAGALTKDGAGSLVLTNANTFAGGTTIAAGTLQIGNGGTTGSITGNVTNNGVMAFNRSDSLTFAGTIAGAGALTKAGIGNLILTGVNTYSGGTTVSGGRLQLGDGTTAGSIVGDVALSGSLLWFQTPAAITQTFAGTISGNGGVTKGANGTAILTGANTYSGQTTVTGGTLLINGDQSGATGLTVVSFGGTLGGTGVIGGDVNVTSRIAPGGLTGPGTLTINGGLTLAAGANLDYEFGQSDVVGGPLNDLTQVGGNLTLDGTINVTVSPGGNFGPGLYRVISYGGTLNNQGLNAGAMPPGSLVTVQTAIAGQVNLVNLAGATLNFWDGADLANKSDGAVNGGDGTWQNSSGNDNWTETSGAVNGAYTDASFAIFAAAPGTVNVDNSLGAVSASGLQFASNGYSINGQNLTLVGPQSTIRVGDGTAAGLGMTATINAALIGSTQLVKADLGTLVLSGTNTYTGGTQINAGTLRISSDAYLGDAAGALTLNGGTLNTTADIGSSRAVNLLATGTLSTDASTTLTLGGVITGASGFTKAGAGSLVLTGANSFAGDVDVTAGSLFVNGNQSAAAGAMSIATGATLGGSGIIGGNVTLADGATLAAGTNNVGTLTINGNLALGAGTLLDFAFGQANVAGGTLNDLVNVGGDLALDGTINVSVPTGGTFGPGIYRVFNYGGSLTDNGLALGTMPGGSAVSVQTAVAGQVNLVNTAGLTLSFWDGNAGPKNDGAVNGGDGVWRVGGGSSNWTEATGSLNADYAQDSFAIFSAAPGTVTIDDVGGNILASGMQFASDGYTITGDALTLTGVQAIVQVGDSSAASAGYTATIAAELTGSAGLVKTDAGTLVLAGMNSYTGGTTINGGTVRIAADANLGDAAGGLVLDGGTLNTTASFGSSRGIDLVGAGTFDPYAATALNLDGVISGTGALIKQGNGILTLTADNSYTGGTTIAVGSLQIGNGGTTGSLVGDIVDNGELILARSDTYTIAGQISGTGAVRKIGGTAILTADNSYTGGTTNASGVLQLGNGGTTGSITGDIVNAGTLVFNRSDLVTFGGTISGSGALDQFASGTTILTGANSYSGATTVSGGTLLINGDQSLATGLTTAVGGSTLGGTGTIGGDVFVGGGATLAPGSNGVGRLTINGNLGFSPNGLLNVEFGQANLPGGPLNDLVNVGGDLTLDGTINIAVAPGGTFHIGLYRVINYSGTLTDNGLAIGTLPTGADAFVQTAVAGQVNLINVGGATLNFWDGAAGPKFNGAVNGGDGVWQISTGNDNWADATGQVNAGYDDGAFAIFTGAAGTVTIDNSLGAVTASGLQVAVDGYTITGGDLTLTGPQSLVRVGDGTAGGAGYTATIASAITGGTQLVKTDLGTLVLTGTNSYTGGTAIGGTLRIASDTNLGAAAGGLSLNGGTFNTTADISSTRAVDLAGAGTFLTDAGTTLTLSGAVTGAGSLTKGGAGTLVLAGSSGHTGATNVGAGTLLVNGNYAGATGLTDIGAAGTLGGTGTIGGDVRLASGATLTPGAGGAGTLTINGDLSLSGGTQLAYEFGAANVTGGALNDLVNVGGDLVLDGTINVAVPTGGAFDVGVYRVFNYGGALTDNGLAIGGLPGGSSAALQTSVAGQVNLVNSAGLMLNFWDGAAGPKNNGAINGGAGTWQNSTGNDNWADVSGAVNAAYSDGAFAIFGGTGATVTVDTSLGTVTAAGMQFAANGYTITGNALTLTGPQSTIRVGDGGVAGAGFTATINAALSGDTQLVKTDAGTLILGGTNSYTGGTAINGGTVQISADANLGTAAGNVTLDGGTLATSANVTSTRGIVIAGAGTISAASGTTFTFNGLLSGTGALTNSGAGTLLLTGNNSGFAGSTRIEGTTIVNDNLCGDVNVAAGGRLGGTGTVCTTVNAGTVAPGQSIGTLTVAGTYTGSGGVLEIEAELGGDASPTDRLVVTNGTAGSTEVVVINQGGLGAQTNEGIKIVDVTGGASAGTFALRGDYVFEGDQAVIAGAFGYRLYKNGVASPADGDWYLRSSLLDAPSQPNEPQAPLYQPGVPIYEAYGQTMLALNELGTMQQRIGNRQWAPTDSGKSSGIWGRMEAKRARPNAVLSTSRADVNVDTWKFELGADHVLSERSDGASLVLGVIGGYGEASASIGSLFGNGSIKTKGYSAGATLSWFGPQGFYVDGRAQMSWFDSDLKSSLLGKLADGNKGRGQAYSVEVGKRSPVSGTLSVTPQIQMVYSTVEFDRFTDPHGAVISSDFGDSLKTRWGISIDRQDAKSHIYGVANLTYEWLDGTVTDVSDTPIARSNERLWGELGIGGSVVLGDRLTLYTEASANTAIKDFGNSYSLKGTAGLRLAF